ncbi:kinesin protein-domain-containing protein [Spinellus fusiger]|nr:kinesin protein-domain-containing protein [Spinellus fusiger]
MIAAISPADYEETLSTLRYADQAKKIKNKAVVNEDPNAKLIRELKQELHALRDSLMIYAPEEVDKILSHGHLDSHTTGRTEAHDLVYVDTQGNTQHLTKEEMVDQLQTSEKLLNQLNQTWEEKLNATEAIHLERERALEELGVTVEKNNMGVYTPKTAPHLVNLNEDPLMTECLVYQLKPDITRVGRIDSEAADIRLSSLTIQSEHCWFEYLKGIVTLYPVKEAMVMVNGIRITEPRQLHSGFRIILGDCHVFRFNHPEEARKERDQQRTEGGERCPASPCPSVRESLQSPDVIDWGFAQREAVLHYYSPESKLDHLTDEDLKKLFDDIFRIRQTRKQRSDMDDETLSLASTSSARPRPPSTVLTADEMLDTPYLDTSTMTPSRDDLLRQVREEMQQQLDLQKNIYEKEIHRLETSHVYNDTASQVSQMSQMSQVSDVDEKLEHLREEMERMLGEQKQAYESKIKRIAMHLPPGTELYATPSPGTDEMLIHKTFMQWKSLCYVKMAETLISHAVLLKEVNVIAKELEKDVVYQFVILHEQTCANPPSFWEPTLNHPPRENALYFAKDTMPCVGVLGVDKKHQTTFVWSIEETKARLERMRDLYHAVEGVLERDSLQAQDLFYETPLSLYSLIGIAKVPIQNLAFQMSVESNVDVLCRHSGRVLGRLRVVISPMARSTARKVGNLTVPLSSEALKAPRPEQLLHVGQQQIFEVQLNTLSDLKESDATQIHAQFRLSSFGNVELNSSMDKLYATDPISGFGDAPIVFDYHQTLFTTVTADMFETITTKALTIEIHGIPQPAFLHRIVQESLEQEDMASPVTEKTRLAPDTKTHQHSLYLSAKEVWEHRLEGDFACRECPENGIIMEERHDIIAWIQLCELGPEGEYEPVEFIGPQETGVFSLQQGLQRRLSITLQHTSGKKLPWHTIEDVCIGEVCLVDANGLPVHSTVHSTPTPFVPIHLFPEQSCMGANDGTCRLSAQGPWDSSLHNFLYLNRATPSQHKVRVTLQWSVGCNTLADRMHFKMTLGLDIGERDARGFSSLFSFLGTHRRVHQQRAIFLLHCQLPPSRKLKDLWRLNTTDTYVRGEELLGPWRPRGISLVHDYREARQRILSRQDVAITRHTLLLSQQQQSRVLKRGDNVSVRPGCLNEGEKTALLEKVIGLWKLKFCPHSKLAIPDASHRTGEKGGECLLMPHLQHILLSDTVTKKGYLLHPENANEGWLRHWCVLKRPYILLYTDESEQEERGMMSLTSVRVEPLEETCAETANVFVIYTCHTVHLLRAPDAAERVDWISKIDQFYRVDSEQVQMN